MRRCLYTTRRLLTSETPTSTPTVKSILSQASKTQTKLKETGELEELKYSVHNYNQLSPLDVEAITALESAVDQNSKITEDDKKKLLDSYTLLLSATKEKMRLTVNWTEHTKLTQMEQVQKTASRVGFSLSNSNDTNKPKSS